jgi:hypothetical protein
MLRLKFRLKLRLKLITMLYLLHIKNRNFILLPYHGALGGGLIHGRVAKVTDGVGTTLNLKRDSNLQSINCKFVTLATRPSDKSPKPHDMWYSFWRAR